MANCQVQVFNVLRSVCDSVLNQLGSSLGRDEQLLQLAAPDDCMQAAVSWRVSYKRCALTYLKHINMSRQGVLLKALGNRFGTWSQKDVLQMHCIHFIQKAGKGLIQRGTCLSRTSENLHDHALTELHCGMITCILCITTLIGPFLFLHQKWTLLPLQVPSCRNSGST